MELVEKSKTTATLEFIPSLIPTIAHNGQFVNYNGFVEICVSFLKFIFLYLFFKSSGIYSSILNIIIM